MRMAVLFGALIIGWGMSPRCWAQFRVMTYNIHHGEGTDGKVDLERVARVIETAHPDIVCLQEVDQNVARSGGVDMPKRLGELLGMAYAFGANLRIGGGEYGTATLSRFEIVSQSNVRLPGPAGVEPRGCLKTTVRIEGRDIEILNVHMGLDAAERKEQAAAILNNVGKRPTILAGDFNETVEGEAAKSLLGRFMDSAQRDARHAQATFGNADKAARIDLILASDGLDVLSSRVLDAGDAAVASDHRPYMANFGFRPAPETAADRGVCGLEDDERVNEALTEGTE